MAETKIIAYALSGTIGQPDAGNLNSGTYALNGDSRLVFWATDCICR
jgi:hypothetical protein